MYFCAHTCIYIYMYICSVYIYIYIYIYINNGKESEKWRKKLKNLRNGEKN